MEFLGHTQTASYMTGPRATSASFLPSVGNLHTSSSAASPMRRSLTSLPWRPTTFFQSARQAPNQPLMTGQLPMSARAALGDMEGIKVPSVFTGSRNGIYTRFTPNEWMSNNLSHYTASDRVRSSSERIRFDTIRVARETEDRTRSAQVESGRHLGDRLVDINYWKAQLHHEIDNMVGEIGHLVEARRVAEKALAETANPLHIAQECLYNREKRLSIDLVHDNVEKDLLKEIDTIKNCQERVRRVIDKANAQVNVMRSKQHEVERDQALKEVAIGVEERAFSVRNDSRGIQFHNGIETIDRHISVPESWAKFSNDNIQRSQAERAASKVIRQEIETVLNICSNEMYRYWNQVNASMTTRVSEVTEARNRLQAHLSKVLQEIFDMESNIAFLKHCIAEKEAPMQVAQTRLETRTRRPNIELCRDPAQHRLVSEVYEIRESVESLHAKLVQSENAVQHLLRQRSALEADLSVKNNSLFIDREKCMHLRKNFPMTPRVASY